MLVLRPGALGDTLLAVPALRALRSAFGPITLAAHGAAARLLRDLGEVDDGLPFDDPRVAHVLAGRGDGQVVAWLERSRLPHLRALLVAPSRPADDTHCARHLLRTLAPLGVPQELDESSLRVVGLPSHEILIHPGSGSPGKNWPPECFAELIALLPGDVRLIVGEADVEAAGAVDRCVGKTLPKLEHPTLTELAQRLAGCAAYVGNDSGVSHLAGLSGARSFVLFGPTNPVVWSPIGPGVRVRSFAIRPEDLAAEVGA